MSADTCQTCPFAHPRNLTHPRPEWPGCDVCLRRLSPPGERSPWLHPPLVIAFWCEYLMEAPGGVDLAKD